MSWVLSLLGQAAFETTSLHTVSVAVGLLILAACLTGVYAIYAIYFSVYSNVPGPTWAKVSRLWLSLHEILLDRNEKIYEWHERYGPVVLIGPGEVSFATSDMMREIYGTAGRHAKSSYFNHFITYNQRPLFSILGYDDHRDTRRLTSPFFQATNIYKGFYVGPVRSRVCAFVEQVGHDIQNGTSLNMLERVNLFAFDNITQLIFGPRHCSYTIENPCQERVILKGLKNCQVWNNLLFNFPLVYHAIRYATRHLCNDREFLTAEQRLLDWTKEKLALIEQDSRTEIDGSFLHALLVTRLKGQGSLSREWVAAEVVDNINAGQTTVMVALTYMLWNFARHPEWQVQVREELRRLLLEDDGMPSFSDVERARILDACVRESYRVNPLSSGRAERVVPFDNLYEGVHLPRGTIVSVSAIALHRSRAAFEDHLTYDPSRWLEAGPERVRNMERHFMPFGYGARLCLGKAFATVEIKLLLACLLLRYEIREDEESATNVQTMKQSSTQDALPIGLRCDLRVTPIEVSIS